MKNPEENHSKQTESHPEIKRVDIHDKAVQNLIDLLIELSEKRAWARIGNDYKLADDIKSFMQKNKILQINDKDGQTVYTLKNEYGFDVFEWKVNIEKHDRQ